MTGILAEIAWRIAHAAAEAVHDAIKAKVADYDRQNESAEEMHARHVAECAAFEAQRRAGMV